MNISFRCFLSVVLILIFNHSFFNIVKTTELHTNSDKKNDNKFENSGEYHEVEIKNQAEIHSSFSEEAIVGELLPSPHSSIEAQSAFKNIDVSQELSEASGVVFSLIDTASELKNRIEIHIENDAENGTNDHIYSQPEEMYIVRAEPKTETRTKLSGLDEKEVNESVTVTKSSQEESLKTAPQHEDIPSFREWTQKQLAEAERKKVDQNSTTSEKHTKSSGKFRIKNYASPDCGAKIVSANPESVSSSSVLSSSKDEYMLNYCTNRIWFVIELCEAIQAKQLDLANFELFSSSPKEFAVSISHRFPTRDWSNVGKFTAIDSRDIQTFNLNPHLFGRYIKVELFSHYGKEQFCPISWVGVFGTSEFEVLEKEDERHVVDDVDDDDEDLLIGQRRDAPKNLFISATDAVLSIVKKATAPFMKAESNDTQNSTQDSEKLKKKQNCITPRYIIVCDNCSQSVYDEVFNTISCQQFTLLKLINYKFVRNTLINAESCLKFGLDFNSLRSGAPYPSNKLKDPKKEVNYLTSLLKNSFVGALCNTLAVSENKVVVNASDDALHTLKNLTKPGTPSASAGPPHATPSHDCKLNFKKSSHSWSNLVTKTGNSKDFFLTKILKPSEQFTSKIEPTKTLNEDEIKRLPPSDASSLSSDGTEAKSTLRSSPTVASKVTHTITATPTKDVPPEVTESLEIREEQKFNEKKTEEEIKEMGAIEGEKANLTNQDSTFDSILSEINELEKAVHSYPSTSTVPRTTNLPTESIFLRLANRIKVLEINMSLSSTYLEELSKRYRNQLEVLSKTINGTAQKIEERYKLEEERERLREKEILLLRVQLANLTRDMANLLKEKNSWRPRASSISQHIVLVSIEILFVWIVFCCWRRTKDTRNPPTDQVRKKVKRRKSLEGVTGHSVPLRRKRRPSDEALAISRNYNLAALSKIEKKRKRKKKDSKCSVNSIHTKRKISENSNGSVDDPPREITAEVNREFSAANNIIESSSQSVETTNRFAPISSLQVKTNYNEDFRLYCGSAYEKIADPPVFLRTAMAARNSRLRLSAPEGEPSQETSTPSRISEGPPPREKKISGTSLKKYMKKFFDK